MMVDASSTSVTLESRIASTGSYIYTGRAFRVVAELALRIQGRRISINPFNLFAIIDVFLLSITICFSRIDVFLLLHWHYLL
jgi:hypothetical protein